MHTDFPNYRVELLASPSHFARQLAAANRLAPAEAYRGHTALLLSCGERADLLQAEEALAERWGFDAVHRLSLPVRSWSEVGGQAAGTESWLRAYVLRALDQHDPNLLAILDDRESAPVDGDDSAQALPALLHRWGVALPVAVLRIRPDSDIEWLVTPQLMFRNCG